MSLRSPARLVLEMRLGSLWPRRQRPALRLAVALLALVSALVLLALLLVLLLPAR